MPRNTREWAHRKIQQAESNIDWAGTHLQEVKVIYQKAHPEIAETLSNAQSILHLAQTLMIKIRGSF